MLARTKILKHYSARLPRGACVVVMKYKNGGALNYRSLEDVRSRRRRAFARRCLTNSCPSTRLHSSPEEKNLNFLASRAAPATRRISGRFNRSSLPCVRTLNLTAVWRGELVKSETERPIGLSPSEPDCQAH
ncbi:hypothetical protein CSUI_008331 [Cystoisospora suis]|uniref:Uncharacterized protein n=1 Tax=Cystoisospora suis TaxID=483139 RepID=A0A2C6K9Z9_9APIC|nr:hypothetical protein CSUI_008331 [Cystoisospora suis]